MIEQPYEAVIWHDSRGTLVHGDNLSYMRSLPAGCCDLIYVDPPFKSDRRRTTTRNKRGFDDRWPNALAGYLAFLQPRLEQMHRLLGDRSSLYVHLSTGGRCTV